MIIESTEWFVRPEKVMGKDGPMCRIMLVILGAPLLYIIHTHNFDYHSLPKIDICTGLLNISENG